MPGRIVIVHDEPEFLNEATAALRHVGHDVAAFDDPFRALEALEVANRIEILVTCVLFAVGKPHGISVALMARSKRPEIRVLFTALPEFAEHAAGIGEFMPLPVSVPELVKAVERLVKSLSHESSEILQGRLRPHRTVD
jgi:DNA-binding NtrC family response regulator